MTQNYSSKRLVRCASSFRTIPDFVKFSVGFVSCPSENTEMAGKGDGEGEGNTLKLEGQITLIKYIILFTNVLTWVSGNILIKHNNYLIPSPNIHI